MKYLNAVNKLFRHRRALGAAIACASLSAIVLTSMAADTPAPAAPASVPPAAPAVAPAAPAQAQPFDIFPADINLTTSRDHQSVVVRLTDANGISHDITQQAKLALENPALAKIEGSTLKPVADGTTRLTVTHNNQTVTIPVTVKDAGQDRPISFRLDVEPVFMRSGCNTGGCHGAARGKDGFELSLFGYNPAADYHRLTREQPGRRINLALPEESLVLAKSTGAVAHTGGKRFEP